MKLFKNNTKQNNDLPLRNTNNRPPNLNDITLPSTTEGELDIGNPTRTSENSPSSHNNYNQNNTDENDSMFRRNKAGISSQGLSSGSRGGGGARGGGGHFQPFHVLRHPFFLATFVVAVVAWFTAFIGQCVTEGQLNLLGHGPVVGVLWFAILLQLVVNIHLFIALSLDALALHRFQLAVVTAILVPFAVNGVQFIYQGEDRDGQKGSSALKAVGAGWLLLAMVDILWVLYLTSEEDSFFFSVFNMFGDGGLSSPERAHHNTFSTDPNAIDLVSAHHNINDGASGNNLGYVNGGGYSVAPQHGGTPVKTKPSMVAERPASPSPGYRPSGAQNEQSFGLRAKALYAYSASPDDPNEVSFGKGEIIEIIDSSGKWWQCKTSAGQVGIAPSNYLQLL